MCDARIRPMRPISDIELACEVTEPFHHLHESPLKDYAYPGSVTVVSWITDDRRNFFRVWPGQCIKSPACNLPNGHHGRCNVD